MTTVLTATPPAWPDGWLIPVLERAGLLTPLDRPRLNETRASTAWAACLEAGVASDEWILAAVAQEFRLPIADLEKDVGSPTLLDADVAVRFRVVPLQLDCQTLDVACCDPGGMELERTVAFAAGHRVRLHLASPSAIEEALRRLYPAHSVVPGVDALLRQGEASPGDGLERDLDALVASGESAPVPVTELVDALLVRGIRLGASDLHLEPTAQALAARYRVDGILREVARIPRSAAPPLVSRLKVMANLDIADHLRPQDGRAHAVVDGRRIDLRISSLPIAGMGEKVVVRILDSGAEGTRTLDALGFDAAELQEIRSLLQAREGLVLVTGPTGSGKTTTLYSALREVASGEVNIVTVEDPIEYRLEGISQVQVNEKAGLTFASTLRSILRQDPDVVLVGEIRDRETAEIAIRAALTGHLVLSTLHTNNAAATIMRLVDIGVDVSALAAALRGVVAQRLIRRACPSCRQPADPAQLPAAQRALLAGIPDGAPVQVRGCPACTGTGYRARTAIAEIVAVDTNLERTIARGGDMEDVREACARAGMRSLWQSGLKRVAGGVTTLHELLDNVAAPEPVPGEAAAGAGAMRQEDIDSLVQKLLLERAAAASTHEAPPVDSGTAPPVAAMEPSPGNAPPAAAAAASQAPSAPQEERRAIAGPGLRLRVLLVDDDAEARRTLRDGLKREGFSVLEAADGEAALEYVRRVRPDVVLTELTLPRLDGFGILRALAGQGAAPPVLVLTCQDDDALAEWVSELGAADYLLKPASAEHVARRLRLRLTAAA